MKRLSFLVAVLTVSLMTLAQPSAGSFSLIPRLGVNFANMTNNEVVATFGANPQNDKTLKYLGQRQEKERAFPGGMGPVTQQGRFRQA